MPKQLSLNKAVEYLGVHPEEIEGAWTHTTTHQAGLLFSFVTPNRGVMFLNKNCGCITWIKAYAQDASHHELTVGIRNDERIPINWQDVNDDNLPVLAEWQRKIDTFYKAKGLR